MKKKDVTLLINTCDSYEDILDSFFFLLHRYWSDLPFDIVLSSESLNYKNKYFKIKNVHPKDKKCSWTKRMYEALKEIETDYVLFLLDDFFLTGKVDTDEILKCLDYLKKDQNIVNFTYYPIVVGAVPAMEGYKIREKVTKSKVALIAALWNKKQFIKYVKDIDENIWEFEINATIRSNTIYSDDVFYCLDNTNMPIPYDFPSLGLCSGKWLKNTIPFFEKEGIKMDFDKRGIYNEALKGLSNAFKSSFKIESYIIPNISEKKYNPVIIHEKKYPKGNFELTYDINGAKEMVKLTLSEQSGFGVKDFYIKITYSDESSEEVSIDKIFGSFIREKDLLIFNNYVASIYIPFKNKEAKKIYISGISICPLSEEQLIKSYCKSTEGHDFKESYLEFLLNFDRNIDFYKPDINTVIKPTINDIKFNNEIINGKKYYYEFKINDKNEHNAHLILSNDRFYSINKLKIKVDGKRINDIEGLPPCINDNYLFYDVSNIHFKIPENTNKVTLEFSLIKPFKKVDIAKYFQNGGKDERKDLLWKVKKVTKKLSGKIMGR